LVHRVIEESFSGTAGKVIMQSDMMQADFLAAAWGHQMNGAGVVTSVSRMPPRKQGADIDLVFSPFTPTSHGPWESIFGIP
jgi:hypothetical protein